MSLKPILLKTDKILKTGSTSDGKWFFGEEGFGCFIDNDEDIIQHHIYLIDEGVKVEEGDYYLVDNIRVREIRRVSEHGVGSLKNKIVVSSDKSINHKDKDDEVLGRCQIPYLSEQAIKYLMNHYKEHGEMPNEVKVEIDVINPRYGAPKGTSQEEAFISNKRTPHGMRSEFPIISGDLVVKLNHQGTVDIIVPEEKKYSKEEVRMKIVNFYLEENQWDEDEVENWLKENL